MLSAAVADASCACQTELSKDQVFVVRSWPNIDGLFESLVGGDELSRTFDASPMQYKAILGLIQLIRIKFKTLLVRSEFFAEVK